MQEKEMILKDLRDNTEYKFEMFKEGDHIHFTIKENNLYAPFTYECDYTLEDLIKLHKAFKSCDNLDEALKHLYNLYDNSKAELMDTGINGERLLYFIMWDISIEKKSDIFHLVFKMTENKDDDLAMLYEIQNMHVEQLKRIKSYIKKNVPQENPLYKESLELLKTSLIHI